MNRRLLWERGTKPWFLLILPLALVLIGAGFYAWGMFGLDNMPPTWPSGINAAQHRYGDATYAYGAGNLAFAGAFIAGMICLILFLITPNAQAASE